MSVYIIHGLSELNSEKYSRKQGKRFTFCTLLVGGQAPNPRNAEQALRFS